jgi:hypothetical protein
MRNFEMKKTLTLAMVLIVLMALMFGVVVRSSLAAPEGKVAISTAPISVDHTVYIDQNHNGVNETSEMIGVFDVYNGVAPISFHWNEVSGATAYRISLVQYTLPYSGTGGAYTEIKVAYHVPSASNGTLFTMGSWGAGETVCYGCPSMFRVAPATAAANVSGQYTLIPGAEALTSKLFVLQQMPQSFPTAKPTSTGGSACSTLFCGDGVCNAGCAEDVVGGIYWCPADCDAP